MHTLLQLIGYCLNPLVIDKKIRNYQINNFCSIYAPFKTSFIFLAGGGGSCRDLSTNCPSWASRGECNRNAGYMHVNCKLSCNKCSTTTKKVTTKRCYTLPPPATTTTDLIPPIPELTTTQIVPPIPPTGIPPTGIPPIPPTTGTPPILPPTPADCKTTEKYGVSDPSIVTDGMMTSSSDDSRWSTPKFGRLGTKSDDKSVGAWCAAYQDKDQFLQIQIEEGTMVGGLLIQGRDTYETDTTLHKFVKFFKLAWKKDDQTPWADVDFVFTTNISDGKSEKKIEFEVPIIAKYLKIIPDEWQHQICMRVEILKCKKV